MPLMGRKQWDFSGKYHSDAIFMDIKKAEMNNYRVIAGIWERDPFIPIIVITALTGGRR